VQVLRHRHEVAEGADIELAANRRDVLIHAPPMLIQSPLVLDLQAAGCDRWATNHTTFMT
jgi:hypothetical protein